MGLQQKMFHMGLQQKMFYLNILNTLHPTQYEDIHLET
jgi:hypothetical protein